jgi:hypothetical protein
MKPVVEECIGDYSLDRYIRQPESLEGILSAIAFKGGAVRAHGAS